MIYWVGQPCVFGTFITNATTIKRVIIRKRRLYPLSYLLRNPIRYQCRQNVVALVIKFIIKPHFSSHAIGKILS